MLSKIRFSFRSINCYRHSGDGFIDTGHRQDVAVDNFVAHQIGQLAISCQASATHFARVQFQFVFCIHFSGQFFVSLLTLRNQITNNPFEPSKKRETENQKRKMSSAEPTVMCLLFLFCIYYYNTYSLASNVKCQCVECAALIFVGLCR